MNLTLMQQLPPHFQLFSSFKKASKMEAQHDLLETYRANNYLQNNRIVALNHRISDLESQLADKNDEVVNHAIDFLDSIRSYEHESGNPIYLDERDSTELHSIYKQSLLNDKP